MAEIYYRIDVFCEVLDLPRAQLRRYERAGLLAPSGEGVSSAGPCYTEEDLRRARRIRRMHRDLGLNVAGLQVAVRLLDRVEALQRRIDEG